MNLEKKDSKLPEDEPEEEKKNEEGKNDAEGGSVCSYEEEKPFTWCSGFVYILFRTLIVALLCVLAFVIPNINILLTIAGALLGTIVNIVLPVLFYNRAYGFSAKNRMLEGSAEKKEGDSIAQQSQNGEEMESEASDPRFCIKLFSWVVLVFGSAIGIFGLVHAGIEIASGKAEHDSA